MKKNKTSLGISGLVSSFHDDEDIKKLERQSRVMDDNLLSRKNELLKKEVQMLKNKEKTMQKQLQAFRKVLFKKGDIHEILEMQHQKIFDLETNLEILQKKYDKILSTSGSSHQTEYAIKCKELERTLAQRQMQHQKEITALKGKMMKMNASQIYSQTSSRSVISSANPLTPLRPNKKFN